MKKLLFLLGALFAQTTLARTPLNAKDLLQIVDNLYRTKGSVVKIAMSVETPRWSRTMKMDMWSKGMDYTLVRIRTPKKDRGVSTLKREKEMWNFFPKINKVIKVPSSMMMGSWMGSDFTNDDLVKDSSLINDYKYKMVKAKDNKTIAIELVPKKGTVSLWGKILLVIDSSTHLPSRQEFFDERGEFIRVMNFKDVKKIGGKLIPTTLELIPQTSSKKGHKTTVKYIEAKFNVDVPMKTFTRIHLQKRR
jgi:outer membrane lipoprotein-sorting protein